MSPEIYQIAIPLSDFPWSGDAFGAFPGLSISRTRPSLGELEEHLAPSEKTELFFASHWATFDWVEGTSPSPAESMNLLLLSLWLTKPTMTHAKFRFHLNRDPESLHHGRFSRSLERFGWIHGHVRQNLSDANLSRAARYFTCFLPISKLQGRLHQALVLHAAGCWASQWHVKFICHSAAIEALLTYTTGGGITRRLAKSFACLTRRAKPRRDLAFVRFKALYGTRSDIMHGRIPNVPPGKKLRSLAQLEVAARQIWRTVLSSSRIRIALEGSDSVRQALYSALEAGYNPPP